MRWNETWSLKVGRVVLAFLMFPVIIVMGITQLIPAYILETVFASRFKQERNRYHGNPHPAPTPEIEEKAVETDKQKVVR